MKSDLNEQLCMKFAVELLEVVSQVKKNRLNSKQALLKPTASDAKYFIRNTDLKNFLQSTEQTCGLYLALSVGQYYHEGVHAQSQVMCLENIRQSYEKWIQSGFAEFDQNSKSVVKKKWRVNLIVTDSHQALNDFPEHEIDLSVMQCLSFVTNPALQALEGVHINHGECLETQYRRNFSFNANNHEQNVKVKFDFAQSAIKWSVLKQFYNDPQFMAMVNYLERCLKFGMQQILMAIREQKKLPSSVMKKVKEGLFNNWSDVLKLNDMSYVVVEIAMLYYKIFQSNTFDADIDKKFLLYPGPLEMMLGVGRNLLAMRFKDIVSAAPVTFLRMQNLAKLSDKADKEAMVFAGDLIEKHSHAATSEILMMQRETFIAQVTDGKVNRAKFILFAMKGTMEAKVAKETRREKRKSDKFLDTHYAKYLRDFQYYNKRYAHVILSMVNACQYQWDPLDPIASINRLCSLVDEPSENLDSPKLSRLNSFVSEIYFSEKLTELKSECLLPLAKKIRCTHNSDKKKLYLTQLVCRLVQYAVDAKNEFEAQELPVKRPKVDSIQGVVKTCQTFFSGSLSSSQENIEKEPAFYQRFQSIMVFCVNNLASSGVLWNDLFNPQFYPSDVPEVDYRSSQEPSQGSFPEMM